MNGAGQPCVLVLRPEPGASATVARAEAIGLRAVAAPLFAIRPVEPSPLKAAPDALLLTSANAARALGAWAAALAGRPVYAVGEATARAARAAGFGRVVAGEGDAAAIVARAAEAGVRRLLHPAGRDHRAVAHPGVAIERVIVYRADPVDGLPPAAIDALAADAVALLHSPRAAALFRALAERRGLGRIACLSPAVRRAAGEGWRAVAVAPRPADDLLLAAARQLCDSGLAAEGRG